MVASRGTVKAILALASLVVLATVFLLVTSSRTRLSFSPDVKFVGMSTPVTVELTNPHGVRRLSAFLEQNGARFGLYEQTVPARRLSWSGHEPPRAITLEVGKRK